MKPVLELVESFLDSDAYKQAADKDAVLKAWLEGQTKAAKAKTREHLYKMAEVSFALIVGQTWFSEFNSLDENSLTITVDGKDIPCKAEMREIEVKI